MPIINHQTVREVLMRPGIRGQFLAHKNLGAEGVSLLVNKDNARAIRFYERHGFSVGGEGVSMSGRPIYKMSWRP